MQKILLASLIGLLAGCGGSSSSSSSSSSNTNTTDGNDTFLSNVALVSHGGVASASYDNAHAGVVNDGDTTAAKAWTGSAAGDHVVVKFDKSYALSAVAVFTNHTAFSSNAREKYIELSKDGTTWQETGVVGGAIPCDKGLTMGNGQIRCNYHNPINAQYIRVRLANANSPVNIFEIQAFGK